jgi:hypothetical protein
MTMNAGPSPATKLESDYSRLLETSPNDWYAVVDNELLHGDDFGELVRQLKDRGRSSRDVLIARCPGAPPYLVLW